MHGMQILLLIALVSISAIATSNVVVDASFVRNYRPKDRSDTSLEASTNLDTSEITQGWTAEVVAPTSTSSDETITTSTPFKVKTRVIPLKHPKPSTKTVSKTTNTLELQDETTTPSEYTTMTLQTFDCGIIPTTVTSVHWKTRPGPVETTATYITQTKTPTTTSTVFTSCSPECTSVIANDVTETITTAMFTVTEVATGCDKPPVVYTDTLSLYYTQVLPVRNTDSVTITITPEEPVTYVTSTYYINTYAETVVENEYLDCVTPPPCKGYEALTTTETETIETTTSTSSLCLDTWAFYQATTTLTEYSCFNPFSVYACPEGGSCPLPITMTVPQIVALDTITVTESRPCYWQRPPMTMEILTPAPSQDHSCSVTVTEVEECTRWTDKDPTHVGNEDVNRVFGEIETLLEKLNDDVKAAFPHEKQKVRIHIKVINRLSSLSYHPSLRSLPRSDLMRLVKDQKSMIESLRRFAKDPERIKKDPNSFFDQLEDLVDFLEKQSMGSNERKRLRVG